MEVKETPLFPGLQLTSLWPPVDLPKLKYIFAKMQGLKHKENYELNNLSNHIQFIMFTV